MNTNQVKEKILSRIAMYCKKDIEDISVKEFYEVHDNIRMLQFFKRRKGDESKIDGADWIKDKLQKRIEMYCKKDNEDISIDEFYEFHEDIRMLLKLSETE